MVRFPLYAAILPLVVGCGSTATEHDAIPTGTGGTGGTPSDGAGGSTTNPDPDPSRPAFCSRDRDDEVRDTFCDGVAPPIGGFDDLYGLFRPPADFYGYGTGVLSGATAVSLAHSTALSGHHVSPLNPRVLLPGGNGSMFLAFQRGVQQVELAVPDRGTQRAINLYLVTFRQACNDAEGGCTPGDLYTPAVERNWLDVRVQDDEDLKNTPSDCRQCHRRGTETSTLLMRELQAPWTHFFAPESSSDPSIMYAGIDGGIFSHLYRAAKGTETYGGLPPDAIEQTSGFALQLSVPQDQPLLFDSNGIMNEHFPYVEGQEWPGPGERSAIWDREYAAFKRGEHLALPYFDSLVTDPTKLADRSDAYRRFLSGELAAADLPDLGDIHPDDPQTRAEMGLQVEPNATPAEALIQACGGCHNDVLDQSVSRARFNVAVPRLNPAELSVAVDRLSRSRDEAGTMPPKEARQLDADTRQRLIDYLRAGTFEGTDTEMLEHAATVGMTSPTSE